MGQIAEGLIVLSKPSRGLAEALTADIQPDRFARFARGSQGMIQANHPAWIMGHLALYPSKCLELVGDSPSGPDASWETLFSKDSQAQDDPEGTIYPAMSEIVSRCLEEIDRTVQRLSELDDDVFQAPQPVERWKQRMPKVGDAFAFLLGPHAMFHLGQLSTWRRCEGLGPVM